MIIQALPVDHPKHKVRFQYLLEGTENGDGEYVTARIYANQAASGHKEWSILDPKRIASVVKPQMIKEMAGFFHFTTIGAIDGILKKGLMPRKEVGTGRADIHFTVFIPWIPEIRPRTKR